MSFARRVVEDADIGVAVADTPDGLSAFLKPGCAAAILRRRQDPNFRTWIEGLDPDRLPNGRTVLPRDHVGPAMNELCKMARTPDCAHRDWLVEDATTLAQTFADLVQARYLRLRLQAVTTNACRKFHGVYPLYIRCSRLSRGNREMTRKWLTTQKAHGLGVLGTQGHGFRPKPFGSQKQSSVERLKRFEQSLNRWDSLAV